MRKLKFAFPLLLVFLSATEFSQGRGNALAGIDWNKPFPAHKIVGNMYFVGSEQLGSFLITTPAGHILINSDYEETVPIIRAAVEKLGFKFSDIKILLGSHAHPDHMTGDAMVKQLTGATVMAMEEDVPALTNIRPGGKPHPIDRVLHDGDTVSLGGVTLTAHKTAGHTRGCTTWTLRAHLPGDPAETMRNIVIVGGTGFWSEYHFVATLGHPVSYPGIVQDFQHTFSVLRALPCDVFLGAHGGYFDMLTKLKRYPQDGPPVFIDPEGYRKFVAGAQETFEKALSKL